MTMIRKLLQSLSFLWALTLVPAFQAALAQAPARASDTCMECHSSQENEELARSAKLFAGDVHSQSGLTCVSCHGGDAGAKDEKASMDPKKGFTGAPEPKQVGQRCGKCHSDGEYMRRYNPKLRIDQWAEYQTSIHGQRNQAGDTKVATCISCHGIHNIAKVNNPSAPVYPTNVAGTCGKCHSDAAYMSAYKIPTDQAGEYSKSVHAFNLIKKRDLFSPTCNDCHGNHGAAPPGVQSVANVCGQCHARQQKLFNDSPHRQPFDQGGMASCVTCHENHHVAEPSDGMLGNDSQGVCKNCHQASDKGGTVGVEMLQAIQALEGHYRQAQELLHRAETAGMEISKPKYRLNEAHEKLIQARVLVHGVSLAPVQTISDEGLRIAKESQEAGLAALEEIQFRRKGLLASLGFILLTALALFLRIRKMEKHSAYDLGKETP